MRRLLLELSKIFFFFFCDYFNPNCDDIDDSSVSIPGFVASFPKTLKLKHSDPLNDAWNRTTVILY